MISARTALYGVVGHPVAHSLSPAMHGAAFAARGIDAVYLALAVPPDRLFEGLRGAYALGFQGLNVTVPHKQRAAEICASLDPVARIAGAVNTLRRGPEGWEGFNTDAPATLDLLRAAGVGKGSRALLLGAGGAARAAAWALLETGATLMVSARRPEAAVELCEALLAANPGAPISAISWYGALAEAVACDVVINGTSMGLGAHGPERGMAPVSFRPGQVAVDFVYGDTPFMREAARAGARLVTGESILVRQGAMAFSLWTGQPPPDDVMAAALGAAAGSAQ